MSVHGFAVTNTAKKIIPRTFSVLLAEFPTLSEGYAWAAAEEIYGRSRTSLQADGFAVIGCRLVAAADIERKTDDGKAKTASVQSLQAGAESVAGR